MKNKLLLSLIVSLFAVSAWAADVSVTEKFTLAPKAGVKDTSWTGDVANWDVTQVRRNADVIKISDTKNMTANWLPIHSTARGTMQTVGLEGGIKSVSFPFARFGGENVEGRSLKLTITAGAASNSTSSYAKNTLTKADAGYVTYSHDFNCKSNAQLTIENTSTATEALTATGICRILVGDVTITPYLLYRNKDVTVGLNQRGYANDGAQDFINNTGGEGSITYSSDDTNIATVDEENGVITPVGVGTTTITATWSEGASTTYTLRVVDGIIAENFSKVVQTGQTTGADWHGDLWDWKVANVRRGEADTLGLNPRIQATALRSNAGSTLISDSIEGGVKHIAFDWRQWGAKGTATKMNIKFYYSTDKDNWGDAVATQEVDAATASTPFEFNEDVTGGAKNAYLKMEYTADAAIVAVMGAMKITPYLLYTTKAATLDTRNSLLYTNNDLINNTTGDAVVYSIAPDNVEGVSIDAAGRVTVTDETEGDFTVTATWGEVTTTYALTVVSRTATTASYENAKVALNLGADVPANTLTKTAGYDGTIGYVSSNTAVATVTSAGIVSLAGGVGQATITATLPQTENYKAAEASYIIYVRDENAHIKEHFKKVVNGTGSIGTKDTIWTGVKFEWKPEGAIRHNSSDTIWGTEKKNRSVWIATATAEQGGRGILGSKEEVEGGIKYLSFYWKQWASESNRTLRIAAFAGDERKGFMEYVPNGVSTHEKFLFGVNGMMKNNQKLYIKNESYTGTSFDEANITNEGSRLIIDTVFITPYLRYEDKSDKVMRVDENYTRAIINNTAGETGTLSYSSSNTNVATVDNGQVTAVARGEAIITAKFAWDGSDDFVETSYKVIVWPVNCETFSNRATASTYAANEESAAGDKATWTARLAGINVGDFEPNVAFIRAPRQGEDKEAYLESSAIAGGIASMTFDWNLVAGEANTNWDIRILINGREVKRLGNDDLAEASGNKMENFAQITIPAINEPDNFTIRFENHSTVNGTYTSGNKARFVIDNICWESYNGTKTLAEDDATNEGWIRANGGQTRTVAITRSALVANVWNTLCLPFAINKADDLGDAEVVGMTNVEQNGDEIDITFTAISGDELAGGMPYLVKPAADKNISGTYSDKQISSIASPVKNGDVTMQGLFSPLNVTANDYNTLFVGTPDGDGNNLFYPQADGQLRGLRAYFKISTPTPMSAPLRRARFVVDQTEVVTGMESVQNTDISIQKIIRDGQLFIIRDGKMYNAQGQIIR
ncbi:MAG: Ig-like domain-containing protein [Paludibacteraceae bacterium]|nr:Ig-like domain-containing protein [Paludibacteraceae bacterium]